MLKKRSTTIAITLGILISMSVSNILTKFAYRDMSPITFIYCSLFVGIVTMLIYTFVIKKERIPKELMTKQVWSLILQIAFFNFVLGTLGIYSLNYLNASTHSYLTNFIGFITMAMSIFLLKEAPTLWQIVGAVIAFSGLRLFFPELPKDNQLIGVVMVLVSITGVAYTNNITRKLAQVTENKISNNVISTLAISIGGSLAIIIYLFMDGFSPVIPTVADFGIILFVGIVTRAIGLTVWNLILRTLRSYEASILGASTVIWTSILSVIFLGETLLLNQVFGILLMLVGLILVQIRKGRIFTKSQH
ncbi:DMT family transporter [Chloroflexota bacterium]|nr:DMT family transporter [Chloroflexota bacterium]